MKKIKLPTGIFEYDPKQPLGKRGGFGQVFAGRTGVGNVKFKGASEYRWHEASYWSWAIDQEFQPFACFGKDADYAASNMMHNLHIAFGPIAIDDEKEDEFHERWIWLFAKAASGQLRRPSTVPIHGWPPQL